MAQPLLTFYLFYLLNSVLILDVDGVNIQLYAFPNFTGLVWESDSTANCNNIPKDKQAAVYAIRTNACFIAYWNANCKSSLSEKFMPGDIILSSNQLGRYRLIYSFHICNEKEGGNRLNVDITEYDESHFHRPKVLESYKNVCSCVNVPLYVQNMQKWSIENHHNALLIYYGRSCSAKKWNPKFVPAGHNYASRNGPFHVRRGRSNSTYNIQSFGPDINSNYFKISCNASTVKTKVTGNIARSTENIQNSAENTEFAAENIESSTKIIKPSTQVAKNVDAELSTKRYQVLVNQMAVLQSQVDQLKRNQEKFQSDMLEQFHNFITQVKNGLRELFAT